MDANAVVEVVFSISSLLAPHPVQTTTGAGCRYASTNASPPSRLRSRSRRTLELVIVCAAYGKVPGELLEGELVLVES